MFSSVVSILFTKKHSDLKTLYPSQIAGHSTLYPSVKPFPNKDRHLILVVSSGIGHVWKENELIPLIRQQSRIERVCNHMFRRGTRLSEFVLQLHLLTAEIDNLLRQSMHGTDDSDILYSI